MSSRRRVVIAGSTGSIGTQALEVIAAAPDRFEVAALGTGSSVAALAGGTFTTVSASRCWALASASCFTWMVASSALASET